LCLLHSDIGYEPYWLDKLVAEAQRQSADVLSAVVPLKGPGGETSTGIGDRETGRVRRLSARDLAGLPPTFSAADLPHHRPRPRRGLIPPR
jgi:hypothetical protein